MTPYAYTQHARTYSRPSETLHDRFIQAAPGISRTWASLRILLGAIFFWAFIDKLLGLGYATKYESAWIRGGSPTRGYLSSATGPFEDFFKSIAGSAAIDVLFMVGLVGVGAALLIGAGVRIAAYSGALMMMLMWSSHFPPTSNPILDDHIIYAVVLLGLAMVHAGRTWGVGRWWSQVAIVRRFRVLE